LANELNDAFPIVPDDLYKYEPFEPMDPEATMPETDDSTPEALDEYLVTAEEVLLPHGGEVLKAKAVGRKRDADGKEIGSRATNPILETLVSTKVEFLDRSTDVFTANVIAENLFAQAG
jgi:hypothetical protein